MTSNSEDRLRQDDIDVQIIDVQEVTAIPGRRPSESVCSFGIPERDDLKVYVNRTVLAGMLTHLRSDTTRELGGLLLGQLHEDAGDHYLDISDFLPAERTESSGLHLRFTLDTWEAADREREQRYPGGEKIVVGWYHSHPGLGVFVSSHDQQVHKQFHSWWQVAIVVDPKKSELGCFRARGDWLLMCTGLYVYGGHQLVPKKLAYAPVPPIRQVISGQQEPGPMDSLERHVHFGSIDKQSPFLSRLTSLILLAALLLGCIAGLVLGAMLAHERFSSASKEPAARQLPQEIGAELLDAATDPEEEHRQLARFTRSDMVLAALCTGGNEATAAQAEEHLRASLWIRRFAITARAVNDFLLNKSPGLGSSESLDASVNRLMALSHGNSARTEIANALARYLQVRECFIKALRSSLIPEALDLELVRLTELLEQLSALEKTRTSLGVALSAPWAVKRPASQEILDAMSDDLAMGNARQHLEDLLGVTMDRIEEPDQVAQLAELLHELLSTVPESMESEETDRVRELLRQTSEADDGVGELKEATDGPRTTDTEQ